MAKKVTLIPGDGIGPEVAYAAKSIIEEAGAAIDWEICEAGSNTFAKGIATGVPQETIDSIKRNRIAIKGPLETPVGYGGKSANVTLRKLFDTYGNIRPVKKIPGIQSPYSHYNIDMVIVRENVEDLYTGIEHMQTADTAQTLKLITRQGSEKIARLAFELALAENRKTVHCATKANIMKLSEGMMKRTFEEVAKDYPSINAQHILVDNCAHQMVLNPEQFDIIVTTNMNGDILSDLGSALVGGLGIAPGANLASDLAIFEAVHGSAPTIAGQNKANPTAFLLSALMMLRRINEFEIANLIEQAIFVTIANGRYLTEDIARNQTGASTTDFTQAVIRNLGKMHPEWEKRDYKPLKMSKKTLPTTQVDEKTIGIDIFVDSEELPEVLGKNIENFLNGTLVYLKLVANRGIQVYPMVGGISIECLPHYQCRILSKDGSHLGDDVLGNVIEKIGAKYKWCQIEKLFTHNAENAFSQMQGES